MTDYRKVSESPITQGISEEIAYQFDFGAIGTPSSPVVTLRKLTGYKNKGYNLGDEVTVTGAASVLLNVVTTGVVSGLEAKHGYRLSCYADVDSNYIELYVDIWGE